MRVRLYLWTLNNIKQKDWGDFSLLTRLNYHNTSQGYNKSNKKSKK